jgi:hypothetical protein
VSAITHSLLLCTLGRAMLQSLCLSAVPGEAVGQAPLVIQPAWQRSVSPTVTSNKVVSFPLLELSVDN